MTRIYGMRVEGTPDRPIYSIIIDKGNGYSIEEVVSETIFSEIQELQREIWRLDRRESRHCVHLENVPDCFLPHEKLVDTPECVVIRKMESELLESALLRLSEKQRRRFVLRYVYDWSIKRIARYERCSDRSIKYSLSLAKRNLKSALAEIDYN